MQISEGMDVVTSDDKIIGIVEHLLVPDSLQILTTENTRHIIPALWILTTNSRVHISKSASDARAGWVDGPEHPQN